MHKVGRNDPCPCGSGEKYKNCCWRKEFASVAETKVHDGAVARAIAWLEQRHRKSYGAAVAELMDALCADREAFAQLDESALAGIEINVIEWLLAEGEMLIKGEHRRIAHCLLAQGGPLFTVGQRAWIQQLSEQPLRLYEVTSVVPGAQITLCDALNQGESPIVVHERSGTEGLQVGTRAGFRIMKVEDHHELSGAAYPFSMFSGANLTNLLRDTEGNGEKQSGVILSEWVKQYVTPPPIPEIMDAYSGDPIQLITDHYRVSDWEQLAVVLAGVQGMEGNREQGWTWLMNCDDGQTRPLATISRGNRSDRMEVFYRTRRYADEGRGKLDEVIGSTAGYLTREIVQPLGTQPQPARAGTHRDRSAPDIDPETMAQVIEQALRRAYAHWADEPIPVLENKTPRQAIRTPGGLERVKGLIRSYEDGEERQAREQGRREISFEFLWDAVGLERT